MPSSLLTLATASIDESARACSRIHWRSRSGGPNSRPLLQCRVSPRATRKASAAAWSSAAASMACPNAVSVAVVAAPAGASSGGALAVSVSGAPTAVVLDATEEGAPPSSRLSDVVPNLPLQAGHLTGARGA